MKNNQKALSEETAEKLVSLLSKAPGIYHIRKNQLLAGATATVGLIIFSQGIQNFIEKTLGISSPLIEIIVGFVLLVISGVLLKKLL